MNGSTPTYLARGAWSDEEHARFLEGLRLFPNGPWKVIADHVATRSVRQVQTHAQLYHERAARRLRDLRIKHERLVLPKQTIEQDMKEICETLQRHRVPLSPRSSALQQRSFDRLAQAPWMHPVDYAGLPQEGFVANDSRVDA